MVAAGECYPAAAELAIVAAAAAAVVARSAGRCCLLSRRPWTSTTATTRKFAPEALGLRRDSVRCETIMAGLDLGEVLCIFDRKFRLNCIFGRKRAIVN